MPQRFSEDEARRIFARAAERQHAEQSRPEGLSLEELQEIGRAAGLDPAHVAAAVAEVRHALPARASATLWGVDLEPRVIRVLPGTITDEVWAQMVGRVRPTFKTIGVTSTVGRVREWNGTNSQGGLSNLRMTADPVEDGTRVVLETSRAGEAGQWKGIWAVSGGLGLVLVMLLLVGDSDPGLWLMSALLLVLGAAMPIASRAGFRRWAEKRQDQFEDLLDEFERIMPVAEAGAAPAPLAEPAASGPGDPLGLDALAEPEDERDAAPERRRQRA